MLTLSTSASGSQDEYCAPIVGRDEGVARGEPCIPTAVRRQGRILLNQQLWLWGQDIRRQEGNALLEYGFARQRPPAGEQGSNAYTLQPAPGRWVILWGFGFFYRDAPFGSIFLPRFTFTPRLARADEVPEGAWLPKQMPDCRAPRGPWQWERARRLLLPALCWIAEYERWVLARRGPAYRCECVGAWEKGQGRVPAERIVAAWEEVAERCDAAIGAHVGERRRRPGGAPPTRC